MTALTELTTLTEPTTVTATRHFTRCASEHTAAGGTGPARANQPPHD